MLNFVVTLTVLVVALSGSYGAFLKQEKMNRRSDFIMKSKANPNAPHEMIFAVKQKNLEVLEKMVIDRATPGNPNYLKWMTFNEVGELTSNFEAAEATTKWLESHDIKVSIRIHRFSFSLSSLFG